MGIDIFRTQLEKIDNRILKFLNLRMKLAQEIGEKKKSCGYPILDTYREDRYLKNLKAINRGPLRDNNLEGIYREIFSSSRSQQGGLKIGCPESHFLSCLLASLFRFGSSSVFVPISMHHSQARDGKEPEVDIIVISIHLLLKKLQEDRSFLVSFFPSFSLGGEIDLSPIVSSQSVDNLYFFFQKHAIPKENADSLNTVFLLGGMLAHETFLWVESQKGKVLYCSVDAKNPKNSFYLCEKTAKEPDKESIEYLWKKFTDNKGWIILIGSYPV
ncbi:chorismate mutase [Methylacidiphilum sp. Yel]|uniref:chorismate mutase n=1 Tax=Methylacidiphilum sp. Yel TaxID=1847730 RepID=UPI00106BAC62|nr:chorismate mutase [Methylacidiphilum sp. Yel]TFE68096.1 chorismate mutase [Methylacidiphilum sp. Yel]